MTDQLALLQEFHREKQSALWRHESHARRVAQYDVNNTYQYIINREDTQLSWLDAAIRDLGGTVPAEAERGPGLPESHEAPNVLIAQDARDARAFVDRWRPRVDAMTHARHRSMLRVILGEAAEQQRSFEQAEAGRTDLLGRRGDEVGARIGTVMPERWIE